MMDIIALLCHLVLLLILPTISIALFERNVETDQYALLAFKSHLFDPSDILTKNWTNGVSVCNWTGVTCSSRHHRVVALNVSFLGLQGSIAPEVGNLSFLNSLDLSGNNFHGNLPQEMVHLRRLKYINIGVNGLSGAVPLWFGFLQNLQHLYLSNNSFTGPIPISLFNASKLESLFLSFNELEGNIPEEISNLGSLTFVDMQSNQLTGSIPRTFFNLSSLQRVSFRNNSLTGNLPVNVCSKLPQLQYLYLSRNKLSGQIELRFDNCSELQILELLLNNFSGTIPGGIGNLTNLKEIDLGSNFFTGEIPTVIGNLSNLEILAIEYNNLTGTIPKEIGNLEKLKLLSLGPSALSGQILTIFNMSCLNYISLGLNNLSGSLPPAMGRMLPNLEVLALGVNKFSGVIPVSISNLTKLIKLDLSSNQFTGPIPTSLGSLSVLEHLNLQDNYLTSSSSRELSFLSSLVNCRSLRLLSFKNNPLKGILPSTIANFSNSFKQFYGAFCEIEGNIPQEIGNMSGLLVLTLAGNDLTGPLPSRLKELEDSLQVLRLYGNKIQGYIPHYFCNFRELNELILGENQLFGQVPECLGNVTSLRYVFLESNRLYSRIPASLGRLKDLLYLDIHSNFMSGHVPQEIGNLKAVISIELSHNKFSGNIPASVGGLQNLINLSLADNQLQGSIPESIENMVGLESLDISHNNLTGGIPTSMASLLYLRYFNVSFNHLRGEVPKNGSFLNFTLESFMSNEALCGGAPHLKLPPCPINSTQGSKRKRLLLIAYVLLPIGLTVFALVSIWFVFMKNWEKKRIPAQTNLVPGILPERISYYELQQATNGFSESNLLAIGGYGSVYKGALRDGTILAIKVFNLCLEGAFNSFDTECEVLRNLRHRNLVKVISNCSNSEFKALVLKYMPNGSLEKWLYSHNYFLNFLQRLDIMIDVASALDYLHHGYSFPVIHCDLKPSNVLLDEDMTGCLTDFGISQFFNRGESMKQTKTLATIGYIAPEYGSQGTVSTSCDVYCFGILLMETFSRKKPTDEMFVEDWGLKEWVTDLLQSSITEFIDHNLIALEDQNSTRIVQAISTIMELSLRCTKESPEERISTIDALQELKKIKSCFLENELIDKK